MFGLLISSVFCTAVVVLMWGKKGHLLRDLLDVPYLHLSLFHTYLKKHGQK